MCLTVSCRWILLLLSSTALRLCCFTSNDYKWRFQSYPVYNKSFSIFWIKNFLLSNPCNSISPWWVKIVLFMEYFNNWSIKHRHVKCEDSNPISHISFKDTLYFLEKSLHIWMKTLINKWIKNFIINFLQKSN